MEQKYAAAGVQSGTGTQKLAEVMTLAGAAVTSLLTQAGVESQHSLHAEPGLRGGGHPQRADDARDRRSLNPAQFAVPASSLTR